MAGVMMRDESSILGLVEIVGGVAIAAAVREIADSSCRSHLRSVIARERCWKPGSHGLWGLAQPGRGRSCPHLGSRLVSAMLTYRVRCRTLSCEERCGCMIANPVKSTCTSTTPQLSERAGADACL